MKGLVKKISFRLFCGKNIKELSKHEEKLDLVINSDDPHRKYLQHQLRRSILKRKRGYPSKQIYLIDRLREKLDLSDLNILCIGCRSIEEIKYFKSIGAENTIGIDLFSENKEIIVMDMHNLTFEDSSFDVILSCHSLEHAKDYYKAISEFIRVAKDRAFFIIEVPVNYDTTEADLWDFGSLQNLKRIFTPYIKEILFEETLVKGSKNNFAGTDVIKMIFRINKST